MVVCNLREVHAVVHVLPRCDVPSYLVIVPNVIIVRLSTLVKWLNTVWSLYADPRKQSIAQSQNPFYSSYVIYLAPHTQVKNTKVDCQEAPQLIFYARNEPSTDNVNIRGYRIGRV